MEVTRSSSSLRSWYVCMCSSLLEMSRCHACGLRNSECHTCACRTALDRARDLEETRAGPSGGGGGDRGSFKHRGRGQARWPGFRAWGSGGDGIIISLAYAAGRPRDDGTSVHLATTKGRFMPD